MPLIIDTASSSRALAGEELRSWASSHSAFISSEMRDLRDEREAVAAALRELGMRVVMFEDLGGRDEDAERAYLAGVESSDIYIGIVGDRYGTMQPSGRSPTHEEYLHARSRGRRISIWVAEDGANRQGNARDFLQELRTFHTTGAFRDAEDLARRIVERIAEIAADSEAPWVKVGDAVVRADVIRDEGQRVTIQATVRDERVARYLESLRPGQYGRGDPVSLTTASRSGVARVEEVVSESRAQSVRTISISASIDWAEAQGSMSDAGTQGFTADDLAELGLREGLFGDPLPDGLDGMRFMVDMTDPLEELRGVPLPEGSVAPIARLLVVEHLLQARRASSIDDFALGPVHSGRRRLAITYTEPRRYTNVEPQVRQLEGSWPAD